MAKRPTIDEYIAKFPDWRGEVAVLLRSLVLATVPEAREAIKWAQPVFEDNGPFCYFKVHARHVTLGFWRGAQLASGKGVLQSSGEKMAHARFLASGDVHPAAIKRWIREAAALNRRLGDPTKGPSAQRE